MHRNLSSLGAIVLLTGSLLGCGSDDGGESVTESPNLGEKTEALIKAADGGEVALAEAGITLTIPAGALASDETITAEVVSKKGLLDAEHLAGNVVEFGPDGLTFEAPVTLELDLAGASIPDDAKVAIAWYDAAKEKWNDLPGSAMQGGKVTAQTTHFTIFAVRFVVTDTGKVVQEGGKCEGTFDPCGGDIEGTWRIVSACADLGFDDVNEQCAGATASGTLDVTGDVTFGGGMITGTLMFTSDTKLVYPKTCIGEVCPTPDDPSDPEWVDTGDSCEAEAMQTMTQEINDAYTVEGGVLTSWDAAAGAEAEMEMSGYCVQGDTVVVSQVDEEGKEVRWTAERQ